LEEILRVDKEQGISIQVDDFAETGHEQSESLGSPTLELPTIIRDHLTQVASDNTWNRLELHPPVIIEIVLAKVHDFDGEVTSKLAERHD